MNYRVEMWGMIGFVIHFLFCHGIQAQLLELQTVIGIVTDVKTGSPIESANVFIARSTMGAATDKRGYFHIRNVPNGTFEIVVSVIGYDLQKKTIHIVGPFKETLHFKLESKVLPFPEVVVSAADMKRWKKDLKKFRRHLLSNTRNANLTSILNPEVLSFTTSRNRVLEARAREPLIIENHALGYRITYVLENFEVTAEYTKYSGIPKFDEMEPISPEQWNQWNNNRRRAYEGSLRHLIKTICDNYYLTGGYQIEREYWIDYSDIVDDSLAKVKYIYSENIEHQGFYIIGIDKPFLKNYHPNRYLVNTNRYLTPADLSTEMFLKFPDHLEVSYEKEVEEISYLNFRGVHRRPGKQTSWIRLEADSVLIDRYGRYFETYMIHMYGYWAWERLADMLPFEYDPEEGGL